MNACFKVDEAFALGMEPLNVMIILAYSTSLFYVLGIVKVNAAQYVDCWKFLVCL